MTTQQSLNAMEVSLTAHIEKWVEKMAQGPEGIDWTVIGYCGNDVSRLMAKSAMVVLESYIDVYEALRNDDMLKE